MIGLVGSAAVLAAACGPAVSPPSASEPIKIGYVWGVTGAAAEIVRPASEATRAYFDHLNKHGGINGRPVQMVEIDSKYQVPLAQEGYKKVTTDDHVSLVVLASTGDTEASPHRSMRTGFPPSRFRATRSGPSRSRIRTSSPSVRPTRTR